MFNSHCSNIIITITIIISTYMEKLEAQEPRRVCAGTSNGYSRTDGDDDYMRYKTLERSYGKNCQYVETNLEIVEFRETNVNMTFDFLRNIKEVFGYVLIAATRIQLNLDELEVIRGVYTSPMYSKGNYSLLVETLDEKDGYPINIHMPKLREISKGSVCLRNINRFCFISTIEWTDIVNDPTTQSIVKYSDNSSHYENTCPPCHKSCGKNGCWGKEKNMCQEYNQIKCDAKCKNRCVVGQPNVCCSDECSAGCSNSGNADCFSCKHVVNDGVCEKECPRRFTYDFITKTQKFNAGGKYVHDQVCTSKCPRNMFVEQDSCVSICNHGYKIDFEKFLCIPCKTDCPVYCEGQRHSLTVNDLKRFKNCEIVKGSLRITKWSFSIEGQDDFGNTKYLTMEDLKIFENVELVTDAIQIEINRSDFTNINFLRKLKVIQGQRLLNYNAALIIAETGLTELGLDSLKVINKGNVIIRKNYDICYVHDIKWMNMMDPNYVVLFSHNKNASSCESEGHVCDRACTPGQGCMGPMMNQCVSCSGSTYLDYCLVSCLNFSHSIPLYGSGNKSCSRCHSQCVGGCHGPMASECWSCAKFKFKSSCVEECPPEMTYNSKSECVSRGLVALVGGLSVLAGLLVIVSFIVIIVYYKKQMTKSEEKKLLIAAKLTGVMECEPLKTTDIQPNMAQLKTIKESELRCGGAVGSGAFGTVYKGLYIPDGENLKIPVAIKVLNCEEEDENGKPLLEKDQMKQILDEAKIMASVMHPFCMHILAFCIGKRMMIISQFMPQGSLLEYVQNNKNSVGSKHILNWSSQIAKGMEYLEEKKIIHRDLAARNVLVHSPNHVRITDFGLAKLVPEDEIYFSEGGKLPIKWLALESIRVKIFTHKSDVWSFGVTLWEICTFGQRPYDNTPIQDFVIQLEKGERLHQPAICTIDVFMVMIKCWLVEPTSRPTFKELAKTFTDMAQDPGRYLVIENDELKRIPSDATDQSSLLSSLNMGSREGLEKLITADEYIQLINHSTDNSDQSDSSSASIPLIKNNALPGQRNSKNRPQVPLLINSDREVDHGQSSSGSEPRYTPDPTVSQNKEPFKDAIQDKEDNKTNIDINTNTDYLIPRSRGQPQYLECINESDSSADLNHISTRTPLGPYPQGTIVNPSVHNPEYFGNQQRNVSSDGRYINGGHYFQGTIVNPSVVQNPEYFGNQI